MDDDEHPSLGDQEWDILRFISEHAPLTVREVASRYGEAHDLARTTILTVMERLRKKGFLQRNKENGAYRYSPRVAHTEVQRSLIRAFVERTLEGSVSPFVAYLAETKSLSPAEIAELRQLVDELETQEELP